MSNLINKAVQLAGYRSVLSMYVEEHYTRLLPESAHKVWIPLKDFVIAGAILRGHVGCRKAWPGRDDLPALTVDIAEFQNYEDYEPWLPTHVARRAIVLSMIELELTPFSTVSPGMGDRAIRLRKLWH